MSRSKGNYVVGLAAQLGNHPHPLNIMFMLTTIQLGRSLSSWQVLLPVPDRKGLRLAGCGSGIIGRATSIVQLWGQNKKS